MHEELGWSAMDDCPSGRGKSNVVVCADTLRIDHQLPEEEVTKESTLAEIDDRLVTLVVKWWEDHNKPVLLSQLGTREEGKLASSAREVSGGLADYIRSRLAQRIRVIQHDVMRELVGAVPADVNLDKCGGANALLERTRSQISGTTRYHRALWAAFRMPLEDSSKRYICQNAPIHFEDIPPGQQPRDGYVEIDRSFVANTLDAPQVQEKIEDWLAANDVDPAAFHISKGHQRQSLPANNLLDRLLVALDPDELRRITMPLDIVEKFRRQPL